MTLEIKKIEKLDELKEALKIQKRAWEFESLEDVVPLPIFVLSARFGGLVLGAFFDGDMAGFSLAFPLLEEGELVLHSHMTAVKPEFQGRGIGYQIKLAQRNEAKKMGYQKITWTYDPLQARNAYFNIVKLGARVSNYFSDFYGPLSSKFNRGFPTHRFLVEWMVDAEDRRDSGEPEYIFFMEGPEEVLRLDDIKGLEIIGVRIPGNMDSLHGEEAMKWFDAIDRTFPLLLKRYEIFSFVRGETCYYKLRKK